MKKITLLLSLLFSSLGIASQTNSSNSGFVFPLGCRVVLQMDSIDKNGSYSYSVIYFEELPQIIDTHNNDDLFFKNIPTNAIQIIFGIATHGKNRNEVKKNYSTALFIKSNHLNNLKYKADILKEDTDTFKNTSVIPLFKQIKNGKTWPYLIHSITLYDFEAIKQDEVTKEIILKDTLLNN